MASNAAAWLSTPKDYPFTVGSAPLWTPGKGEILVRNHAVAINPVDGSLQSTAWWPLSYPTILGQDVAGEVVEVGPDVTRFKKGDRVLGHAVGMATKQNRDDAFQHYIILQTNMVSEIPDDLQFEKAAVVPLGCSTAASGLFQDEYLQLQLPTVPPRKATGETLLIWGGASSVGSNAIQLAIAAGYEVITTASPHNFDYVKRLGASEVFSYNSPTVRDDLLNALRGKIVAGALDCIGGIASEICIDIIHKSSGNKFVATTKRSSIVPDGVTIKAIFGTSLKDNRVGKAIYEDFIPKALRAKIFITAPEPLIAGEGLESIQQAVDLQKKGVSAKKVVVVLK
ncbi:zinc-binding oxidoreductase CipB [Xylogone sp. PMI_703]|nr:zinc-binding oxidoreductase CipB [Xylogone sp. PMI_703]